jgi:hypothetical protein
VAAFFGLRHDGLVGRHVGAHGGSYLHVVAIRLDRGLVVGRELAPHVERRNKALVIVPDAHELGNMADRAQGRPTDLPHALDQLVHARQDLLRLLVEQQVTAADRGPACITGTGRAVMSYSIRRVSPRIE